MDSPAFFQIRELGMAFGGVQALEGIDLDMDPGQILSVIGPNGAGKTTLFNCISGLYTPGRGRIVFQGREIQGKAPHAVARAGIARTFQNIELFSRMNTMENIMLGRHLHMKTGVFRGMFMWGPFSFAGREESAHRKRVEEIIDFLELQHVRDIPVGALPYGIQKRIELARALALEPRLLLLDEPCAGMNQEEKQDMIFWIRDIRADLGISILLIEHDMTLVMDISDRVLAVNFGRPVTLGTPADVGAHPEVLKAYLGEEA